MQFRQRDRTRFWRDPAARHSLASDAPVDYRNDIVVVIVCWTPNSSMKLNSPRTSCA